MEPNVVYPTFRDKVRLARVSEQQWGRVSRAQLRRLGVSSGTVAQWIAAGYLHPLHPRVYAVGHRSGPIEADLAAALLYAGLGAMLSHATAAWWWQLTDRKPRVIEVSTRRHCRSLPGVKVHGRRSLDRVLRNGLTVTTVPQTLLDYASQMPFGDTRYVLAEADYRRLIKLEAVEPIAGRGKPGARALRRALAVHWPDLARTRSRLERAFLFLCEAGDFSRPQVNVRVCGFTIDCFWPQERVAVELDGGKGHGTERQVARDHGRDLKLREARIVVRRYAEAQVYRQGERVLADLREAMALATLL
jgi:very-short-patch-repair endonuclease